MKSSHLSAVATFLILSWMIGKAPDLAAAERTQSFNADPGWEGHNNRSPVPKARPIRQDFGYSPTRHAGGRRAGEIGGMITPAAEPAYYAKRIAPKTFDDALSASGTFASTGRQFNILIGFFNSKTLHEWRTPNTIALRLYGRGDVFYAYLEYMSSRWRAGADSPQPFALPRDPATGRQQPKLFARNVPHTWTLDYDPRGNNGAGSLSATIDGEKAVCFLGDGHKADGATFDRFGVLNVLKQADDGGEVWLDDLTVNGEAEAFDRDPGWDQFQNRRTYVTQNVRPRFNFGYTPTHFAAGQAAGELGGLVFRGDNRYPERLASYADRLEPLSLDRPFSAAGKLALRRGVSDSTTLLGFFQSTESRAVDQSQQFGLPRNFLGIAIEGPSSEGFYCYPAFRLGDQGDRSPKQARLPHVLPNGDSHEWSLRYVPTENGGGRVTLEFDKQTTTLDVTAEERRAGARLDRFGIVTTWIDGNGQDVYFDDLTYTWRQD